MPAMHASCASWPVIKPHSRLTTKSDRSRLRTLARSTGGNKPSITATLSRRALLAGLVAFPALQASGPSSANKLRSVSWDDPCLLNVQNDTPYWVKAYWINYDGDPELWKVLEPGCKWAVDTFSSHPWRFTDADTGEVLDEVVVGAHHPETVHLCIPGATLQQPTRSANNSEPTVEADSPSLRESEVAQLAESQPAVLEDAEAFEGWDGIGGTSADYVPAQVAGVAVTMAGGRARLLAVGFPGPLDLYFDNTDAMNVLMAYKSETRRPLTALTWANTLQASGVKVERVLITRVVGDTFYCRIVLQLPGGELRSVDSRPSDGLALALQCRCPIVVAKSISRLPSVEMPPPEEAVEEGDLPFQDPNSPSIMPAGPKDAYPFVKSPLEV